MVELIRQGRETTSFPRSPVPELAVHKNSNAQPRKRKVDTGHSCLELTAVGKMQVVHRRSKRLLRRSVTSSYQAHALTCCGRRREPSHSERILAATPLSFGCIPSTARSSVNVIVAGQALFPDARVRSVAEYASVLARIRRRRRILWFRGQNNVRWELVSSLARGRGREWFSAEAMLVKRFRQNALPLLSPQVRTEWDWLLLMQHHGVPTRLLDWTENALAGLFFATVSARGRVDVSRTDGCVWVLDPVALNREANLPTSGNDIPTLDVDVASLREYLPTAVAEAVSSGSDEYVRPPLAVLAQRMFARLVAQQGVFTLIHRDRTPIEHIRDGRYVGRILVPRAAKARLARELAEMGVTRLSLFPELDSVAEVAKGFLK